MHAALKGMASWAIEIIKLTDAAKNSNSAAEMARSHIHRARAMPQTRE